MKTTGKVWKFGNDIDTDLIIPARYLNTSDPVELARHCMEDADPEFAGKVATSDIIVAGKYFGCGSSREHAHRYQSGRDLLCDRQNFARIFYRNAFNMGLAILECEHTDEFNNGDRLEVDFDTGKIRHLETGNTYPSRPIPPFMQKLIQSGGLMAHIADQIN